LTVLRKRGVLDRKQSGERAIPIMHWNEGFTNDENRKRGKENLAALERAD